MKESKKRKARLSAQDRIASLSAGNAAHVHKALRVLADTAHCPELLLKDLKREGLAAGAPMLCSLTAKGYRLLASLDQPITAEGPKKAQAAIRLPDVLDRLAHPRKGEARLLEAPELAAARRFQTDLARAGLLQRVTQNWSLTSIMHSGRSAGTPSRGEPVAMLDARDRVRKACRVLGPDFAPVLIDICLKEKSLASLETEASWPKRSAKVVVMLALRALARHYGLTTAA